MQASNKKKLRCNSRFTKLASHEIASLCRIACTVLTTASLVGTFRVSVLVLQIQFCKLSFAGILLQNECCTYVRAGSALHTYVRKSNNCVRLVLLFSLTMFVLHIWRCIVVWQLGFCNTLYYTACLYRASLSYRIFFKCCFVKFVLQTHVAPLCLQM